MRVDASRCVLCGEPNDCALARRGGGELGEPGEPSEPSESREGGGDLAGEDAAPCWCRPLRFPPALLARARTLDGGTACVCRRCLEAALARGE